MATSTVPLPRSGLPDTRTLQQKADRLAELCHTVFRANDRDILTKIAEHIPTLLLRFLFLDVVSAPYGTTNGTIRRNFNGFVGVLLAGDCRIERHQALLLKLAERIPNLKAALHAVDEQGGERGKMHHRRRKVLKDVLNAGKATGDEARVWQFLSDFFNDQSIHVRKTCSGCLCAGNGAYSESHLTLDKRGGYKEYNTTLCKQCTPLWFRGSRFVAEDLRKLGITERDLWSAGFRPIEIPPSPEDIRLGLRRNFWDSWDVSNYSSGWMRASEP